MAWHQLYVKAPEGNGYTTAEAMKRIDDHLMQMTPASFVAPDGLPIKGADDTWEIRVMTTAALDLVKSILTDHYGLEIIREVKNEN